MTKLDQSLRTLYEVFAEYTRPPRKIDFCPCCMSQDEIDVLVDAPADALSAQQLSTYSTTAIYTVGGPAEYVYFFPRILELSLQGEDLLLSPESHVAKLRERAWDHLVDPQIVALQEFLAEAVRHCFDPERHCRLEDWLAAAAFGGCQLTPLLKGIEKSPPTLAHYYGMNIDQARKGKLPGFRSSNAADAEKQQIVDWLTSDSVLQLVLASGECFAV